MSIGIAMTDEEKKKRRRQMQNATARKNRQKNLEKRRAYEREWYAKRKATDPLFVVKKIDANRENYRRIGREFKAKKRAADPLFRAAAIQGTRDWRELNTEKVRESCRKWRKNNPERVKALMLSWKAKNPERNRALGRAHVSKRRAAKMGHPLNGNPSAISRIHQTAVIIGRETGIKHEVDHIIPLLSGGAHHEDNMQILPQSINRSKGCNAFSLIPGRKSFVDVPPRLWPVDLVPFYVVAINMLGRERITNGH